METRPITTTGSPQPPNTMTSSGSSASDFHQFLKHLHRGGNYSYWWTLEDRQSEWWPVGGHATVPNGGRSEDGRKQNHYFGLHPTTDLPDNPVYSRSRIATIAAINCLFGEFDAKDRDSEEQKSHLYNHIRQLNPPPSVIIDSGGGYHAYWLLKEPFILSSNEDRERARHLQAQWVVRIGSDASSKDLARVLRIPGTDNYKYDPARPVRIISADLNRTYALSDLEALVAFTLHQVPTQQIQDEAEQSTSTIATPERLLNDAFIKVTPSSRNDTGFWLACQLRDNGYDKTAAWSVMLEYQTQVEALGDHEYGQKEAMASLQSAYDSYKREPWAGPTVEGRVYNDGTIKTLETPASADNIHNSDLGNAKRLVQLHGQDLLYVHHWRRWCVWDGIVWKEDVNGEVQRRARDTVRTIYAEAQQHYDLDQSKRMRKWAVTSESRPKLVNMVTLAEDEASIPVHHEVLDADPWLLTVNNGTLDLRTGALYAHQREDLHTKMIALDYDPQATAPEWTRFLRHITDDNVSLMRFMQKAVGYTLTGITTEQCLFFLYGTGRNGKSTFSETLMNLFGDFGMKAPTEMIMAKPQSSAGIPNDVAKLPGKRFVLTSEVEGGRFMAESRIKDLTGGDTITARFMRGEWFDFRPSHKLWIYGNYKPVIRGTDEGIWRRIRTIPFSVTIPEEEVDRRLPEKLQAELPGILTWAVEGCLAWQKEKLQPPKQVAKATANYRSEMDVISPFVEERCITSVSRKCTVAEMYNAYKEWCEENSEFILGKRTFNERLVLMGFHKRPGTGNATTWFGIDLARGNEGGEEGKRFTI